MIYNSKADPLTVIFTDTPAAERNEDKPGVIPADDGAGNLVFLEMLDASRRGRAGADRVSTAAGGEAGLMESFEAG